jgi:hypothetical protein
LGIKRPKRSILASEWGFERCLIKDLTDSLGITLFLIFIGLFQMTGDLLNLNGMRALGASFGGSPAPKVFCSSEGLETFSSTFFLTWTDKENVSHRIQLTPQSTKRLKGPYNRRNVYGAVLSYGPILSKNQAMKKAYESTLDYALNQKSSLLKELGIDKASISKEITIEVIPKSPKDHSHLELVKKIEIRSSHEH